MKVRCVRWAIFFCFFILSISIHAQTLETVPTIVDYSPFFDRLSIQKRENLEEVLYSSYFAPADRTLTAKEKIDAFIIGHFTLSAQKKHPMPSLEYARAVLYELYDISSEPLDRLNQKIEGLKYDLTSDFWSQVPVMGRVVSSGISLKKIKDLEIKKKILQDIDSELPTSADEIRKVYVLAKRVSKNRPPEFSTQIDAYFGEDPSAVSIRANLDTLISHNPMIKNQIDILIASGQITSLEHLVLILKKDIEMVEMTVEQQQTENEIRATYLEVRRASVGVSQILGVFDPNVGNAFNRIANPLIDMSEAYSTLKKVQGFKLDLTTLSACATGIGAVFALADFFITSSQPSEMEVLMEHLNSQFEKLHERFDKLHEHMDLVHRDLMRAASELFSVMQKRFDTVDSKLEEIKKVLHRHSEKLKVIEDLIRDQRAEARNIEMDKDRLALDQSIRRYQEGTAPLEECLFDCVSHAEGSAKRLPNLRDMKGNQSDIRNGFFHKVLEAPYFVNLSQLLNLAYPDLPQGSEPRVGVYEDEIDRALRQEGADREKEAAFTQAEIKNIEVWADGVNTYLQQVTSAQKNSGIEDANQRTRILRQIDQFLVSGKKLKRSLEGLFYQLSPEFEKTSVRREFVAKLFRNYIGALNEGRKTIETQKSHTDSEEKLSGIDVLDPKAIYTLPEVLEVSNHSLSPIFPSELKAALLLGIGQLSISYESPRWGVVDNQEGRLLFNVVFKFQEESQEPKMIGAVTIVSNEVISGYSGISPQDAFNRISANDLTSLVMGQIKNQTTPTIQRQCEFYDHVELGYKWKHVGSFHRGTDADIEVRDPSKDVHSRLQRDRDDKIYTWKGFDLDSTGIRAKAEAKRQAHAEKLTHDIVQEIKNESPAFERLEGQKALLEAYLSLGLNQSFATHVYLKSFFNRIFSHGLMDKEEALYFLSQSENNPRHLFKEGLRRAKKLSCLLLGQREGANAIEAFAPLGEEQCEDNGLYSTEGLLAERLNTNELPDILNKTLRRLYRAQRTFSADLER